MLVGGNAIGQTATLSLQTDDACSTPTTLATSNTAGYSTPDEWVTFTFPSPVTVTQGVRYYITATPTFAGRFASVQVPEIGRSVDIGGPFSCFDDSLGYVSRFFLQT